VGAEDPAGRGAGRAGGVAAATGPGVELTGRGTVAFRRRSGVPARGSITVAGSLARKPGFGGHAWVFLQYLLGFKRQGWDVLFLDQLRPEECTDDLGKPCPPGGSRQFRYLNALMERFGLGGSFALLLGEGGNGLGVSRGEGLE